MFRVGQKVVCINAGSNGPLMLAYAKAAGSGLKEGEVYTVTSPPNSLETITLQGVEGGWCRTRFRPVVERKTDISIFKALLQPNNIRENV